MGICPLGWPLSTDGVKNFEIQNEHHEVEPNRNKKVSAEFEKRKKIKEGEPVTQGG